MVVVMICPWRLPNDFKAQIVLLVEGRGYQICRGMEFIKNPIVLILHADQQLKVNVLQKIRNAMNNKEIIGGCVGSIFESLDKGQWVIHFLNVFRARVMRIVLVTRDSFLDTQYGLKSNGNWRCL